MLKIILLVTLQWVFSYTLVWVYTVSDIAYTSEKNHQYLKDCSIYDAYQNSPRFSVAHKCEFLD